MFISEYLYDILKLCNKLKAGGNHTLVFAFYILYQMRDDRNAFKRRSLRNRINESYVKYCAIKEFKLPFWNYIYIIRPVLTGLLPEFVYDFLHRKRLHI